MRTVVFGSRPDGHARVVIELLCTAPDIELVGLIDDYPENAAHEIAGLTVIGTSDDLCRLSAEGLQAAVLGFGAARGRAAILAALEDAALALPVLVHPTAFVAASAELEPGCQLLPGVHIGPGAKIGRGALVNTNAIVEHDVNIADAAVIDPGAVVTGRAVIGSEAEVGSGAVVLPDVRVGARAIVGAGAVVTRGVAEGRTVVGVPARVVQVLTSNPPEAPQAHLEPLFRLDSVSAQLRAELDDICLQIPIDEGGGSSLTKVLVLASLIIGRNFQRVVEIGVYRGRAFLALGATMRALGRGEVTGIDPYTAEAAIQRDDHKVGIDLQTWPHQVDWEHLYAGVLQQVEQRELAAYCRLDRRTSADAATDISPASIELLHMDGNHDRAALAADLALYLPKMRLGGIVVMDDVTWPSIHPLFEEVASRQQLLLRLHDPGTFSTFDDFGVVQIVNDVSSTSGVTTLQAK